MNWLSTVSDQYGDVMGISVFGTAVLSYSNIHTNHAVCMCLYCQSGAESVLYVIRRIQSDLMSTMRDEFVKMLFEHLHWLIPIATECFFPIINNQPRRFRWPGISAATHCLFLESMYVILGFIILILMAIFEGIPFISGLLQETALPQLPDAQSLKKGQRFHVTKLDASKGEVTPSIIKGFVRRSEPVIIKNMPKDTFSALAPGGKYHSEMSQEAMEKGTLHMNIYSFPRGLGKFGRWIQEHVPKWPVLYMARFSGSYKSGYAHIDTVGTYNVYYVARGRKNVWILPRQYNHLLRFKRGYNAAFIPGSDGIGTESLWWTEKVPGVWEFDLVEGDVLIFNNTACLHKFANATKNPVIFTTRLLNLDFSPVIAKNDIFNWNQARFVVEKMLEGTKTIEVNVNSEP